MSNDIFSNSVRSNGDLAGVFEYDGQTGYFYLYRTKVADGPKVIDSLHIVSGRIDFADNDVSILWDRTDTKVALFIKNSMWAVFDSTSGQKFGENYRPNVSPSVPPTIAFVKSTH